MKTLAGLLSLSLALGAAAPPPPAAEAPAPSSSTAASGVPEDIILSTITVTAPRLRSEQEIRVLKAARIGGAGVGVLGAGWMAVAIAMDFIGPFGWAASLAFLGGMTSYLAHRRLQGAEDFPPAPAAAGAVSTSSATAASAKR